VRGDSYEIVSKFPIKRFKIGDTNPARVNDADYVPWDGYHQCLRGIDDRNAGEKERRGKIIIQSRHGFSRGRLPVHLPTPFLCVLPTGRVP
jgi:hypothetical protein